jgi:hypothetical protein
MQAFSFIGVLSCSVRLDAGADAVFFCVKQSILGQWNFLRGLVGTKLYS